MRLFLGCILVVALALSPAIAGANDSRSSGSGGAKTADSNANSTSDTTAKPDPSAQPAKSVDSEVEELRDLVLTQAQQLQQQSEQLKQQQEQMKALEERLNASSPAPSEPAHAATAPSTSGSASTISAAPASPVSASTSASLPEALPSSSVPAAKTTRALPFDPQNSGAEAAPSPLSFKIGNATFTPGGFMDLTNYFRSKDIGSGIGTTFSSVNYNNTPPLSALTEDHFSIQNSRISLRVDSNVAGGNVIGYVEADFLGFTNDNLEVTSNSNTLRSRLYFIDYRRGKWEILGGQDWSMVTPSRTGIAVMPADVFNTQDMDTNYNVGLTWERTPQFRFILHPTDTVALGFSIENPQQYTGSAVTFPTAPLAFTATQVNTGTSLNSTALGSSTTANNNLANPDVAPDLIAKIAFDPKVPGHGIHLEAYGLFRTFKIDSFTGTTNLGTTTIHGGAGSFNSNFEIFKNFRIFETAFFSSGGGREIGNSNVPDFIVTPAATATSLLGLSPVHSDAGILGFEYQTTPKFMLYGYYGDVYVGKDFTLNGCTTGTAATGTSPCGYGYPAIGLSAASANSANRSITEPTIGFIPTFWRNPNYGALSLITQFSYLTRSPWVVTAGSPKDAHAFMAYIDLRYTLP